MGKKSADANAISYYYDCLFIKSETGSLFFAVICHLIGYIIASCYCLMMMIKLLCISVVSCKKAKARKEYKVDIKPVIKRD